MSAALVVMLFILTRLAAQDVAPDVQPMEDPPPESSPPPPPALQVELPTVRIFNKANPMLSLTGFWNGKTVLALGNGSVPYQQWIVDSSWGAKFTDAVGSKSFMLVNKATGMVLRHGYLDGSLVSCGMVMKGELMDSLWTKGPDLIFGFHTIRACSKVELNLDVEHSLEKKHTLVKEGSKLVMLKMSQQETQYWKMELLENV